MKILIVDDNPENIIMLQALLEGHGYEVVSAEDGVEALEKAYTNPPQLIISDILMPRMDGFALCRHWKKDDCLKSIPFVVYTATYTDPKDEKFAQSLGVDRFIIKPTDPDDFIREVQEVLAEQQKGVIQSSQTQSEGEESYLRQHNETLVRKLEAKIIALQNSKEILEQEVQERRKTEEQLLISLEEKKTLLQELYHRTFNNMQVIRSLLVLQAASLNNEQVDTIVQSMENRIQAMALVHHLLLQSKNLSQIDLKDYIPQLCRLIMERYDLPQSNITFDLQLNSVPLLIDSAIPCGLILNELLTNSIRHGFPNNSNGRISIQLSKDGDDQIELTYTDDGVGLPADFDLNTSCRMGLQTVFALGEKQLQGSVTILSTKNLCVQICFSDQLYSERVKHEETGIHINR